MLRFKNFSDPLLEEKNIIDTTSQTSLREMPPSVLTMTRVGITTRSSKGPRSIILYYCQQIDKYFTVLVGS